MSIPTLHEVVAAWDDWQSNPSSETRDVFLQTINASRPAPAAADLTNAVQHTEDPDHGEATAQG